MTASKPPQNQPQASTSSKTTPAPTKKPIDSRTTLSAQEQEQFDMLFKQFELNFNQQRDGLNAINLAIVDSTKQVTTF